MRLSALTAGCVVLAISIVCPQPISAAGPPVSEEKRSEATFPENYPDPIDARARWFAEGRSDETGSIAVSRARAVRQLDRSLSTGALRNAAMGGSGFTWQPIGPAPLMASVPYSGRVASIAVDPTAPGTVYIGGASGGLWRTTDSGATWTPLTDDEQSLSIGAITFDPSNAGTIYAGTGEWHFSCDSYFGAGILRSEDGGSSWSLLAENEFTGTAISGIVVSPTDSDVLVVSNARGAGGFICTRPLGTYGIWKSVDHGASWTLKLGAGQTGNDANTTSLVVDPDDPDVFFAGVAGPVHSDEGGASGGVWKSVDGGESWSKLGGGLPTTNVARVNLAIDPADGQRLFAAVQRTSDGSLSGVWRSHDGGSSWTQAGFPSGACSSYCWYCMILSIAPDGAVWFGGVDLYRSADDGVTWSDRTNSGLHADQHVLVFDGGKAWSGNDGGVFSSTNNGISWTAHNQGLYLTQFYPGASLHPTNPDIALGGAQDNGTNLYEGSATWQQVFHGDGAFTAIDLVSPDTTWYVSAQYLFLVKTTDGGLNWHEAFDGIDTTNAPFIAPYVMCPSDADVLVAGTDRAWRTENAAANWTSNGPDWSSQVRALTFSAPDVSCGTVFAGLYDGRLLRTTDGGSAWVDISGTLPGRSVADIAVDPEDGNVVYAALNGFGGSHLYRTDNALAPAPVWMAADAGIPDTPVNAVLVDPTDSDVVLIGTDVGIFRSETRGSSWSVFGDGLPNVIVFDLVGVEATDSIVAFTHGRGAFRLAVEPGLVFADGFESGDTSRWSAFNPR